MIGNMKITTSNLIELEEIFEKIDMALFKLGFFTLWSNIDYEIYQAYEKSYKSRIDLISILNKKEKSLINNPPNQQQQN